MYYTIDVVPGPCLACDLNNITVNGDFEQGSEVSLDNISDENVFNGGWRDGNNGYFDMGRQLSDGHPFSETSWWWSYGAGNIIRDAWRSCPNGSQINTSFGTNTGVITTLGAVPTVPSATGDRYARLNGATNATQLCQEMEYCKRYHLQVDLNFDRSTLVPGTVHPVTVGFLTTMTNPWSHVYDFSFTLNVTVPPAGTGWYTQPVDFYYCGGPNTIINFDVPYIGPSDRIYYDNVVLFQLPPEALLVNAGLDVAVTPACNTAQCVTLNAIPNNTRCGLHYQWNPTTGLSNPNVQSPIACPLATTTYTVTVTDPCSGATGTDDVTVTVVPTGCLTLTKTVTPPSGNTYAGAPVMFTIQACNNDVADQVVNITDEMPAGFVPAFNSPNNPYWPTASVTIPAGECISTEITGYFTQIGPHTNSVTLEQVPGISLSADATITLLQGCPMLVYGSGGCLPGAAVNLCLGMHTQLTNVESVDYYIVYPDFLEPPAPGSILGNISSPFGISAATIGTPAPLAWPSGPGYGYATVPVHVAFTAPVSASPPYSFFCVGFQVGSAGLPPGVNAVWTWASTTPSVSGWNRVTVNMTGGSTDLWTQAYHILFTGCPGINGPNANFTAQTSSCGGAVTVSAELTDPDAIHIWTWGDERTTPTNGAPGWTYDYFGPITDNQGWPVNIPPAAPGTYTITHTVVLDGVATNSTQAVTIHACCAAALSIPHGTLSSTLPSTISGTVDIQGQFVIDQNLSFNGVQVTMEPGAEITVQPGRFLVVRDSELGSCNGTMWKGITVNSGSYLEMQRNTVKDAEYVVTALDGATVLLFNNDITDDHVGLYVPNTPGVAFNSVSAHVIGNRFNSTGTLAQAYPGQTTALGNVGFAAVLAWKTALDLTGYPGYSNTVDGMSNGILAFNSDLSVERFDFKNVQPDGAYSVPNDANGSGIHAYGRNGVHYLRQKGNGKQGLPSFQNCRRGIYTLAMNTDSRDNNMQGVGTAYRVDKTRKTTEITNNRVNTKLNGMEFNQNAGTLRFWVTGNDITFGTLTELVPAPLCNGILVADGNSGGQDSRIEGNTISMLSHPLAKTGINLLAARKWTVAGNSIVMGNNSVNRYGIANYGSSGLNVSCNTVLGAGTNYPQGQAAIYSNMGEKLLFGCNNVDLTTNGMLFNGVAYDVDVRGNSIRRHKIGMHLSGNAIIGTQELKGNLWYNPPAQGGMGAWYEPIIQGQDNPNASLNPFTYNPTIIGGGGTEPTSWAPYPWFEFDDTGANYTCIDAQGESYCSQFHVAKLGSGITELDGLVAKDSLRNAPYTEESKWMLKDGLYKKLDDDPDLRDERPDMANFYAAMQGTATAAFKAIDDGRPALYNMDSTVVAQLQANREEITALMDSVKLRMAVLEDNNLSEVQRAALLAGMLGFREGIRTLATWNTTAMQAAMDSKVLTAEGLKAANSIIGTTELTETNRKVVDGIYLSTLGKDIDTFTVAQSNDLFTIANQCPMLGGNAVYTARALYRLIDETYEFDDQLLCLPHGILLLSSQQYRTHLDA